MDKQEVYAPGWDAIDATFDRLYPEQDEPRHYGNIISYELGGPDPLRGVSVYDGGDYWHFVTYGFSELYEKETDNPEWSGFGFELTMKLKKAPFAEGDYSMFAQGKNTQLEQELQSVRTTLQDLARYVFDTGHAFHPHEYIYTGQQEGIDYHQQSNITGFVTMLDEVGEIETENGKVQFIQLVGMTDDELTHLQGAENREAGMARVVAMLDKLGHTLTDYDRQSLVAV